MTKRQRVRGRFVPEAGGEQASEGKTAEGKEVRAPRPRYCRTFARKRIAEAMPEITETLIRETTKGSYQHAALLMRLGGLSGLGALSKQEETATKPKRRRSGKSLTARLLDDLDRASKDRASKDRASKDRASKEPGAKGSMSYYETNEIVETAEINETSELAKDEIAEESESTSGEPVARP